MGGQPLRKEIKYATIYWAARFFIFIANVVPRGLWLGFCGMLGRGAYHFFKQYRQLSITHLEMAFGKEKTPAEIERMSKDMFVMLGKNGGETIRAIHVETLQDMEKFMVVHGWENAEKPKVEGRGVIFLPNHMGAFELMVTYVSLRGFKPMVIGTPLKDPRLNKLMVNYRNAHGAIPVERGKETFRLIKGLKQGGSTAVLIDQDTKVKSRFVNFFGIPAATPIGATVLAMKTGGAVIPSYIYLGEDNLQHMTVLPEITLDISGDEETDLVRNTQKFTDYIEKVVREHPEQWVWMHERWKTKPGDEIR